MPAAAGRGPVLSLVDRSHPCRPGHDPALAPGAHRIVREDPAAGACLAVAVPHQRYARRPRGGGHHRPAALGRRPGAVAPAGLLPVRDRRRRAEMLPLLRFTARRPSARLHSAAGATADRRRAGTRMGGLRTRPRGPGRAFRRGARTRLPGPGRRPRGSAIRAARVERADPNRPVGLLRWRPGHRVGRRGGRRVRPRTRYRRRGRGLARR